MDWKGQKMSQKTESTENKELLTPEDVTCAAECNTQWQACNEDKPEDKGTCNTKLAKCVKSCDTDKK